jgi:Glycosyltransferase like family
LAKKSPQFRFVVATREKREDFATKTMTGRMLAFYNYPFVEVALYPENTTGLSTIYNREIEKAKDNPAILVFAHDDIYLTDFYWPNQILNGLKQFDVLGVAGNKRWIPGQPSWAFKEIKDGKLVWDDKENLSGIVAHGDGFPPKNLSKYGPTGQPVELLDGLILIAESKKLIETGVRFDERFDFHFYDLDFCRAARSKNLKLGTWPIATVHKSGGNYNNEAWKKRYKLFCEKQLLK